MTWPPPLVPRLVAIAGPQRGGRRGGRATATATSAGRTDWRDARRRPGDRPLRQRRAEQPARRADDRRRRGRQARDLREAARPRRRRELRDLAARRRDRRQAHVRLQLPLRPGGAARARDDRGRRARRDPPLPRPLPAGLGRRPTLDAWRFDPDEAGSGALGDLGAHVDRPRPLPRRRDRVGLGARADVPARAARSTTRSRPRSSSRAARSGRSRRRASPPGARTRSSWEINGSKGSLAFDLERLNELQVFRADGDRARGFQTVLVSEADHPFWEYWWPPGHIIGWEHTFVHEIHHLLTAIAERRRRRARTARRSRTATAPPRSATRSSARAERHRERLVRSL